MWNDLRLSGVFLMSMTILTGVIYPAVVTGVSQWVDAAKSQW